jgi:AraC-like DNA-binding protein
LDGSEPLLDQCEHSQRKKVDVMEMIRPLKVGALSLPDGESRLVCRTILLDMLGEATIRIENGDLAGITGLFWKYVDLSLATLYFPRSPLRLTAHGVGTPDVVIIRATDGPLIVNHKKQHFELGGRDVIFLPADSVSEIILPEGGRFDCAHLPHTSIARFGSSLNHVMLKPFSEDCLPLQLITHYAGYLLRQEYHDKHHASMMVAHFYDLLPVLISHVNQAGPEEVPQNRIETIKALIEANISDGSFSIVDVAKAERITPRAIQKLFSRMGTTYSRYVLERRLMLAKNMILAETATTPISKIVYASGFNDLSYFNRSFRSRYGVKPSELRRMAGANTQET